MFRLLTLRYAPKLVKTKKQASYMLQKNTNDQDADLTLDCAIKKKQDQTYMEDAYNPSNVEKHWNHWWEHKYIYPYPANFSTPTTRPTIPTSL